MAEARDIIIVGGGHNGLVAAFYLAKAGFKPLVLERRSLVGGAAITEEFHPGFRCSTLAHSAGPLRADVVRDMQLERRGLKITKPDVSTVSLLADGRALVLYSDVKKAAQEITQWSAKDATGYADFATALGKISKVIGEALLLTAPRWNRRIEKIVYPINNLVQFQVRSCYAPALTIHFNETFSPV